MLRQAAHVLRQRACPHHLTAGLTLCAKANGVGSLLAVSMRTITSTPRWRSEKNLDKARQRQLAQDDIREEIAEQGRWKEGNEQENLADAEDIAPEIERLDPQAIPGLYPEFEVVESHDDVEKESNAEEGDDSWYVDPAFGEQDAVNVPLWQRRAAENLGDAKLGSKRSVDISAFVDGTLFDMCRAVLEEDAQVSVIDVSDRCEWTSRMVIAEAKGTRHMRAISEGLLKAIKERNRQRGGPTAISVDGRDSDDWMVVDLGSFVVHIMTPEARRTYDLESLWAPAPPPPQSAEDAETTASAVSDENRKSE